MLNSPPISTEVAQKTVTIVIHTEWNCWTPLIYTLYSKSLHHQAENPS